MPRVLAVMLLLSLLALAWLGAGPRAQAQDVVHRCIGANGSLIFSDRPCEDLNATTAPASPAPGHGGRSVAVRGCARTRGELLAGVRAALEAQDVNRLATYYQWTGMGTREAYAVMSDLSAFVSHPLVDARLEAEPPAANAPPGAWVPAPMPAPTPAPPSSSGAAPAPLTLPRAARLRVDQGTSASDVTARVSYFRLEQQAGCWWITR